MSPNAIAVLIGELMVAGVNVSAIMADARANGRVSEEVWQEIRAEIERAEGRWHAAGSGEESPGAEQES